MAYQLLEQYNSSFAGPRRTPQGFAIHWWGDPTQNPQFMGIVNVLLQRANEQSASVNFVAESGRVACLISPMFVAWAQGDGGAGWGNNNLVSIECNPRCTAGDRETVAELIADQHIMNGIPIVLYPHKNFTSTQCPGVWEQWIPSITARAKALVAQKQGNTTPVKPASSSTSTTAKKGSFLEDLTPGEQREALNILRELRPLARDLKQGINGVQSDGDSFKVIRDIAKKNGVPIDEAGRQAKYGKKK